MKTLIVKIGQQVTTINMTGDAMFMVAKEPTIVVNPNYRLHQTVSAEQIPQHILDRPFRGLLDENTWYS